MDILFLRLDDGGYDWSVGLIWWDIYFVIAFSFQDARWDLLHGDAGYIALVIMKKSKVEYCW